MPLHLKIYSLNACAVLPRSTLAGIYLNLNSKVGIDKVDFPSKGLNESKHCCSK